MKVFVDASAIVAMIGREPEATAFGRVISHSSQCITSPIAWWEAVRAIARVRRVDMDEAKTLVEDFLRDANVEWVDINDTDANAAIDAHARFGKGVHPAGLNMGDCFAYASTRRHADTILFKGEDFARTDLKDATLA
ncbi:type II toxin-antitoxin system VapC family toxin [Sphingomonas adhaesiva]|uniref:type II toxin-antitoxin system VapC family toxin n=1 Tax=Sphingomonas adhaesiva TaxID=28212 RepID=UPI002FF825DB